MRRDEKFATALLLIMAGYLLLGPNVLAQSVQPTPSNVTVEGYVAIALSNNLSTGIEFGSLSPLTNDNNASHNYDGAGGNTSYWVYVSTDSNQPADICIRDNANLTLGAGPDNIPNVNYTWDNSTLAGGPVLPGTAMDTTNIPAGDSIPVGGYDYFRFWLDIPGGTAVGTYNNTVYFTGVTAGFGCP